MSPRPAADMEIERAAGEAIGLSLEGVAGRDAFLWTSDTADIWVPLQNDSEAMALVKHLNLHIDQRPGKQISVQSPDFSEMVCQDANKGHVLDLNRAIVECAAKMKGKRA